MIELSGRPWEQVEQGAALPVLELCVTATTLARDVLGTHDLYPIHHDRDFAKANGARDIFLNTMWYQGVIGQYVTQWCGHESFLRVLVVQMHSPCCLGDRLAIRGVVTDRRIEDGRRLVDVEIAIDTQHRNASVTAQTTVEMWP